MAIVTGSVTLIPNGHTNTGSYYGSWSSESNMYANTSSTTYATWTLTSARNSARNNTIYIEFDKSSLSNIPTIATITSISCNIRYYVSDTSYVSGASINLYSNTTAKGTAITSRPTSATKYSITPGSWTLSELNDIRIYFSATHARGTTAAYVYIYGADITINYSYESYSLSVTNTSSVSVSPISATLPAGGSQTITFTNISDVATVKVLDNNVNVSNQLVNTSGTTYTYTISDISEDHTITVSTVTAYNITASSEVPDLATVDPSSGRAGQGSNFDIIIVTTDINAIKVYDNNTDVTSQLTIGKELILQDPISGIVPSDYEGTLTQYSTSYPITNGYYGIDHTSYARFDSNTTLRYGRYLFKNINIPNTAVIESLSCQVRIRCYNGSSYASVKTIQMYAGTTAKGSPETMPNSATTLTINDCGSWTVNELSDCGIRFNLQGNGSGTARVYFYGATLTINYKDYEDSDTVKVYTINNIQAAHAVIVREAPYFEITGSSTFDGRSIIGVPKHVYISGSNYSVTLDGITNPYSFRLADNNIDVTSSVTFGNTVTCIPSQYLSGPSNPTNPNNVLADTSSTSYAQFTINSSNQEWFYKIDTSGIPENAIIKSVVCKVRALNNRNTGTAYIDFYSGNTRKTSQANTSTTATTYTLTNLSDWTAEELQDVRLRINDVYTGSTTSYYIRVYGAELIVEYEGGFYTISNITADHALVLSEAPKYAVSGTSNFTGKSITGTGDVYHGDSITVTLNNITNTKSFKLYDNNVDVTSSVNTTNWTYSLTNVTAAHALRIEEATKYAVTGQANLSGSGFSGLGDVYQGDNITITLTGITNTYSFRLYDNDTDVTSSVNTSNWRYTISNAQGTHALRIEEAPYYSVIGVSNFDGVTITGTSNKKYQGESITVSLSGITDSASYTLYDNDVNKTSSVNGSYQYTISNIQANHTIRVEENDYYLISGVSNFTSGARFSNLPKKVYTPGSSFTVTLTGITNQYSFNLFDNDVDVTSSINSNQYVISNITADHSLRIEEAPYYAVTATVTYSGASITGTSNKVYEGDSITVILVGISDRDSFRLYDNGFEATDSVNSSYQYTISNIQTDHELVLEEIPHYSVTEGNSTLSGATLTGLTNKVYEGNNVTITIEGVSDPYSIKLTDNGIDVSDKLILPTGDEEQVSTYEVTTAPNASYGFNLNGNTGYYTSTNAGQASSAAVARVTFNLRVRSRITIKYINYAEGTYDYGIFGNIDSALGTTYTADSDVKYACSSSSDNTEDEQTLTYDIDSGEHFIDIKYRKDNYTDSNNDNLQFKIDSITDLDTYTPPVSDAQYIIENISENHVLVVSLQDTITVTTSSSYNGASLSPASSTVYKGEPIELTLTVSDISLVSVRVTNSKNSMVTGIFTDNGNGTYTGILTVRENSTVTVIQKVTYNITCTDNATNGNITPTGTQTIDGGYDAEFVVESDHFDRIYLKDNNVIVNDLIESHELPETTNTFIPASFDSTNSTYSSVYNSNNPENGLTASNSSTRCCVYSNTGANAVSKLIYNFNCSSIPENATIDSVTCTAGAACYSSGQYFATRTLQLYSGDTAKGTATTITGNGGTNTSHTLNCGSWTRDELNNIKIVVYIARSTSNTTTDASFSFWGASLSITYHVDYYGYTIENVSTAHTLVLSDRPTYQITASSSTNKATILPASSTIYEANDITFEITTSDINKIKLLDNNVDVTENISIVEGDYLYVIENITGAHTLLIKNKLTIFLKQLNAWTEYSKIYKKINNEWFEQDEVEGLFDTNKIYILK